MQNDFISTGGMLDRLDDISMIQPAIASAAYVIAAGENSA
jgi:hypothetical protein